MNKFILAAFLLGCAPPVEWKAGTSYRYRHVGRPGTSIAYVGVVPPDSPRPRLSVTPPAPSVRDEYRAAAESFAAGRFKEAEDLLFKIYERDKNPVTLLNIARCRERTGRYDEAAYDLVQYFGRALASAQSADGAESLKQARLLLKKIARERGNVETSGRKLAAGGIAEIQRGNFTGVHQVDVAFKLTYDFSLLYWTAVGTFRTYQASFCATCSYQHFNSFVLDNLRVQMSAYFLGATDLTDLAEARRFYDELDAEYRKEVERERVSRVVSGER